MYTPQSSNNATNITGITQLFENVTGLDHYSRYTVVVYALTDKGAGNGSDPLEVLTDESCKLS